MLQQKTVIPPSIELLHEELLLPLKNGIGLKFCKKRIIEHVGFTKAAENFNLSHFFDPGDPKKLLGFVLLEIKAGNYLTIMAIDDQGEKGGGYPVTYILKPSDIRKYLAFDDSGSLLGFKSTVGKTALLKEHRQVNVFSRNPSVEHRLIGLDNFSEVKKVRLGGGFRLQLDELFFEEDRSFFRFSVVFVFNDIGPRATSLMSSYDWQTPHTTLSIVLEFKDGLFLRTWPVPSTSVQSKFREAREIVYFVLNQLLENDSQALATLFLTLLKVNPLLRQHSVEGVFSFSKKGRSLKLVGPEVYDFDGLDTAFIWMNGNTKFAQDNNAIRLKKKLTTAQLNCLRGKDTKHLKFLFHQGLAEDLSRYLVQEDIIWEIVSSVMNHLITFDFPGLNNKEVIGFISNLTGPAKLGRLFKYLSTIPWQPSASGYFSIYERNESCFLKITIWGFDLGFWIRKGKLVETLDMLKIERVLANDLGQQLLRVHLNYLREGD